MVVQVTADDADVGVNDDLTFSIVSGDPASEFEIQNGNRLPVSCFHKEHNGKGMLQSVLCLPCKKISQF